jgi:hypothetical protein
MKDYANFAMASGNASYVFAKHMAQSGTLPLLAAQNRSAGEPPMAAPLPECPSNIARLQKGGAA